MSAVTATSPRPIRSAIQSSASSKRPPTTTCWIFSSMGTDIRLFETT